MDAIPRGRECARLMGARTMLCRCVPGGDGVDVRVWRSVVQYNNNDDGDRFTFLLKVRCDDE